MSLLASEQAKALLGAMVSHNLCTNRMAYTGDEFVKFLTYQLPTIGYWPTVAMTGNRDSGFDSGEEA